MIQPSLQHQAVALALGRLIETNGQFFQASPGGPAWLADNREIVRLLRLAFPGVQAQGSGLEHGQVVGRAAR